MTNTTRKQGRETGSPIPFSESRIDTTAALDLPQGLRAREYINANEQVYYEETGFHTFSMYLAGGYETRRIDEPADSGAPGLFCLMPAGFCSV